MQCKVLAKVFIASALRLSCSRTNNELSLGELMHPKCIYFSKHFASYFSPESPHNWINLQNLTLFLAKVFFPSIFAGLFTGDENHVTFYGKEGEWAPDGAGGPPEGQKGAPHAARFLGRVGSPLLGPDGPLRLGLRRTPPYIRETDGFRRGGLFAKRSAAAITIFDFGVRLIRDFTPGGGIRGASSPSSSPPSSPSTMSSITPSMCE